MHTALPQRGVHTVRKGGIRVAELGLLVFRFHAHHLGGEYVVDRPRPKLDGMVRIGREIKIGTPDQVPDAGFIEHVHLVGIIHVLVPAVLLHPHGNVVSITGVCGGDVHEKLGLQGVVPTERTDDVPPVISHLHPVFPIEAIIDPVIGLHFQVDHIVPHVIGGEQAAFVAHLVGHLGI